MSKVSEGIMRGLQEAVEYSAGNLEARTMRRTVNPVRESYSADEIKRIRGNLGMTQSMLAIVIGVSLKTVESWETGRYTPDGAARRLLSVLEQDPSFPEKYHIVGRA